MDVDAEANDRSPEILQEQRSVAVLFFDTDNGFIQAAVDELSRHGLIVDARIASTVAAAEAALASAPWDVVACEFESPDGNSAFEVLAHARAIGSDVPVIVFSTGLGDEKAVECIKRGAAGYVLKQNLSRFSQAVKQALLERDARREKLQMDEQLRQVQKMESVGRLAGAVAHDFNNLLEIVVGYSELLLQDIPRENHLWKNADEIKKAGLRAASLTRQLLAFSRRQVFASRALDLNELLHDMERRLQRTVGEHVKLLISPQAELGLVKGDPGQLEQVIMNLVLHACESLHGEGRIVIETANVEKSLSDIEDHAEAHPGPHVMLAVSNDCQQGLVGEQVSEAFTGQRRGTRGLGLAMVYEVVQQSKGHIWVQSDACQGTTFKIYLPREGSGTTSEDATIDRFATALPGTGTLVLAEDETATRELIARVLVNSGYRVLEASNGRDALGFFEQAANHVDLLITDLVMPVMGGGELARRATQLSPDTKVLYISGFSDDPGVRQGVLQGAAYLQKPFRLDMLNCKIRELLERAAG